MFAGLTYTQRREISSIFLNMCVHVATVHQKLADKLKLTLAGVNNICHNSKSIYTYVKLKELNMVTKLVRPRDQSLLFLMSDEPKLYSRAPLRAHHHDLLEVHMKLIWPPHLCSGQR